MKSLVLFLALLLSSSASAQINEIVDADYLQKIVPRSPIEFVPFPLVDPTSGALLSPNDLIELDPVSAELWGTQHIKARDFYAELNSLEEAWSRYGYSLRNAEDLSKLKEVIPDFEKIAEQAAYLTSLIRDLDQQIMSIQKDAAGEAEEFKDKVENSAEMQYNELYAKIKAKYPEEIALAENIQEDPNILQKPNKDLSNVVHKEWNIAEGEASTFLVKGNAQLDMGGDIKHLEGLADGRIDIEVMNSIKANILYIYGKGEITAEGMGKVNTGVEVFGNVIDFLTVEKSGQVFEIRLSDNGGSETQDGRWKKEVRKGQDFQFAIGPVPCVVEVGFGGLLYLDTGVNIDATMKAAGVGVYPGLGTYGFASFAVGVPVARAGIEGQLTLLNAELKLAANARLEINPETEKKKLSVTVDGTYDATSLAGRLLLFAEVRIPYIGGKKYTRNIWSSAGNKYEGILFSFTRNADESGYSFTGAPQAADLEEANLDNEIITFFADATQQLQTTGLTETLSAVSRLQAEVNALEDASLELAEVE